MASDIRLGGVSIDCAEPADLARFYRHLLGLTTLIEGEGFAALVGAGVLLTVQRVDDYRPPQWPSPDAPKQMHLDLGVRDLDDAEARALELGASRPDHQPSPDRWRVLLDPAGHPFCITTLIPDG